MTVEILQRQTASTDWGLSWDGSALSPIPSSFFDVGPQPGSLNIGAHGGVAGTPIADPNISKAQMATYIFDQFISFLHVCAQNVQINSTLPLQQEIASQSSHTLAAPTPISTLHQLSLTIHPIFATPTNLSPRSTPHLALLIFFNLIAFSFRYVPSDLFTWLEKLSLDLSQYDIGATTNFNGFLVMLVWREDTRASLRVDERWVWWLTSRLTRVCKRLSDTAWEKVRSFLAGCLLVGGEERIIIKDLGLEELKMEVLGRGMG